MPVTVETNNGTAAFDKAKTDLFIRMRGHGFGLHVDPWGVDEPDEIKGMYKYTWASPGNVRARVLQYSAEVVTAAMGRDIYHFPADQIFKTENVCKRLDQVLLRYTADNYTAKEDYSALLHFQMMGREQREFESNKDAVILDRSGRVQRERGNAPVSPAAQSIRPSRPFLDHALAAQGLDRGDLDNDSEV